jgi:trehalose/maltose transport system substrate-binding protein
MGMALAALTLPSCKKPAPPVTITFLDSEEISARGVHWNLTEANLRKFTHATGIYVHHLPTPEDNASKLRLATDLLQDKATSPDVYGIDTIWSGSLSDDLLDLKPFLNQVPPQDPGLLASYLVRGKLVAMPYQPNVQVLMYRTDLLSKYGYKTPPRNWSELEQMSDRIQTGERAEGRKNFWGFVWSGAISSESEQLTCEGIEWQVGEGGGNIIEPDQTISVNNRYVVASWERAAHWIGQISPPSVVSYTTEDANNDFWISGTAAFELGWSDDYQIHESDKPFQDLVGVTSVPAGRSARVATLGGYGLGVSRNSSHPDQAVKLIQFLMQQQEGFMAVGPMAMPRRQLQFFEVPKVMKKIYPWWSTAGEPEGGEAISRPSATVGPDYESVSQAYAKALHAVLTRQSSAKSEAASLEKELIRITGFKLTPKR